MEYEKEHIITYTSKDPARDGAQIMEVYKDDKWDLCIRRYRHLESQNYTVSLRRVEITTTPVLSHNERHIRV